MATGVTDEAPATPMVTGREGADRGAVVGTEVDPIVQTSQTAMASLTAGEEVEEACVATEVSVTHQPWSSDKPDMCCMFCYFI